MSPAQNSARKAALKAYSARVLSYFELRGATPVEADILQPADALLDLYGEDIRARAYVTHDPLGGEMMLRPDFTMPVVRRHMEGGVIPARYCYAGEVFRKRETLDNSPSETLQVGFELFDDGDPALADAEVFSVIKGALDGQPVEPVIGDMGLLVAAVNGLDTSPTRKAALIRHIWRPRRFRALLDRFSGDGALTAARRDLLGQSDPLVGIETVPGLRRRSEIADRINALRDDQSAPPIPRGQVELIETVMGLRETAPNVVGALRDMAVDMPALIGASDRLTARLDAFAAKGIAVDDLRFEASYLRSSMEYYDGFVFAFLRTDAPATVVATGGRYDALTSVLGGGQGIPAVGAVIRPETLEDVA